MRSIVFIAALLSLFIRCSSREADARLAVAEGLMNEHPDSALAVLRDVPRCDLNSPERRALFALLYSQALDKNYIDVTNDSLIGVAVTYYNAHPEPYRLMLAYYYLSRVQFNAGSYTPSILSAHKAQKYAEGIGNYFFLGLIYRGMAATYNRLYNAREEVSYCTLAHQCFLQAHADVHADFALLDIGRAHHNNQEYDECIRIARQAFDTACAKGDTTLMAESLHLMGCSSVAQQNYRAGKAAYLRLLSLCPTCLSDPDYKNLALIYFSENNADSTVFYQHKIGKHATAISLIDYEMYLLQGKTSQALQALNVITTTQDSLIHHVLNQNISSTLTNYYKQEEEFLKNKLQYEKYQRFGIIAFCLLLTVFLFVFYRIHLNRKQRKIEENMLLAQELSDKLKRQDSALTAKNNYIDELVIQKFATIDKLCSTYYECQATPQEKERIYSEVIGIISKFKSDQHTQMELETFLNTYKNNLMADFRQEFPKLKDTDYQLFLYYALDLSPSTISIFLQEKPPVIYNRKKRLKDKIQSSNCAKKEFFLSIF
ncbi:hypothetical protein [Odoribacter lunatus]|uniref:hypothetical protein n=1 Tax=Odoribacter lunatus TaxID=2941335 RepID=UPI0020419266|nr:hypothetical protein [Odoribacter lunatus]